jgi:hypothetical protein
MQYYLDCVDPLESFVQETLHHLPVTIIGNLAIYWPEYTSGS